MLVREDLLFELIKVEGPKILCHPVVNEIFQEMIADEKYGGLRINKLRESLLLYVYDKPVDEISFPQGRPKIDLGKGIGKSEIYIIYVFLKDFFRWFKIRCSDKEIDNIRELFETEGKEFFSRITKSLKDKYPSRDYGYFENFLILGPFQYTSMIINSDKNLKDEFLKMTWQPNKLAKKLLMILLELKDRTLENILKEGRQKPAS